MTRQRPIRTAVILFFAVALLPAGAAAQSAIAGQVRDNTGAVLPGTTVEVASPALIEGTRGAVSDGQGRYSIVALRPGTYSVTFTLEGFQRVVREGIELPSNFTATVDVTLSVGSLQETVTVTGASPIVDVQQATQTQIITRETLDTIVNARNTWTQANLVAGLRMSGTDVGGSQAVSDLLLESHGASALHTVYTVDGLMVNTMRSDGREHNYYQDLSNQEISIQSTGGSAEASAGGVRLNMVPKDGGNTFSGQAFLGGSAGNWQSNNFTERLRATGLRATSRIDQIFDYAQTQGGPIVRDRLWFFESFRYWGAYRALADVFRDNGSQHVNRESIWSAIVRLNWQATPRNKFTAHAEREVKGSGTKIGATYPAVILPGQRGSDPETATGWKDKIWGRPYAVGQAKWTSPVSNRLLLESGYSASVTHVDSKSQPGVAQPVGTPLWLSRVEKTDLDQGITWNGRAESVSWAVRHFVSSSASYVTGSHNVKVGTQLSWGYWSTYQTANGHLGQTRYRSGVPDTVQVRNYPVMTIPRLGHDLGIYAQDAWTIDRLTLSYGVRSEWLNAYVDEQRIGVGRFVGERNFAKVPNVPDWGPDVSPRFGLAYDVFGNAKTAIRFSTGRYMTPHGTSFAQQANPMALITATVPWNDRDITGLSLPTNGDDTPQDNELDLTRLPRNFGTRQLDRLDPDIKREYNIDLNFGVQHELVRGVAVSAGYYRRTFHNQTLTDNLERDFSDYVPVQIVSPYNGEVITVYNLKSAAELSLVNNFVTNAGKERRQVYNGYEFAVQGRLPGGGVLLGSTTTQRTLTNECDGTPAGSTALNARDDPNGLRFCDRFSLPAPYDGVQFKNEFKVAGSYPLPWWNIQVSANFTSFPGRPVADLVRIDELLPISWNISRTTRYTEQGCAGRPCTPGALVIPGLVESSLIVPLAPAGTERFMERQNQLNFGVKKILRLRGVEWHAEFQIFNALNADTVLNERSANFDTATYGLPSAVLEGRLPRLSMQIKW